jgi:hypothetical protein
MGRKIKRRIVNHKKLSKKKGKGRKPRQKNKKRIKRKRCETRVDRGGREGEPKLRNDQ